MGPDASPSAVCTISNVTASLSPKIATVGIVTWATDLQDMTSASIDFGPTTAYGMTAPVDLTEKGFRTLLLGMKAEKLYHYRITASGLKGSCASGDNTIRTGPLANGLPRLAVTTNNATKLAGGFLVVGECLGDVTGAIIFDADGDPVWWFKIDLEITGAAMTFDAKSMWLNDVNCCEVTGTSKVHLVSMDGMSDQDLSAQFPNLNHQLVVLPDETVAFYGYGPNECDDIKERKPDGTTRVIVNAGTAQGVAGPCHVNAIQYSPTDDTLVFSDLNHSTYTKIRHTTGETVWVLNGTPNEFAAAPLWNDGIHGLDILPGPNRFVMFNNASATTGSIAMEWQLTTTPAKSAKKLWSYTADPKLFIAIMGDVQRLDNGNTIVAYSTAGEIHEVAPDGTLLQKLNWPLGSSFGYIEKRPSLYGHPPRLRIR